MLWSVDSETLKHLVYVSQQVMRRKSCIEEHWISRMACSDEFISNPRSQATQDH